MAYYRREWTVLMRSAVGLTHHTFGLRCPATLQRALAMRYSDQWVDEGCDLASPLIAQERAALVRSYAGLLSAVHHL